MEYGKTIKEKLQKSSAYPAYAELRKHTRRLTHTLWAFRIKYIYFLCVNTLTNTALSTEKNLTSRHIASREIKKTVIIHSRQHFDPSDDQRERKFHYSGIANIARNLWKLLEHTERTYIGLNENIENIPQADLIIGLMSQNFLTVAAKNPQARKILLLVNSHPLYRARVLIEESGRLGKPLPATEWVDPSLFFSSLFQTDAIALIGNEFIRRTYLAYGLRSISIFPVNLGINIDILVPARELRPQNKMRFIYPASHMAIRKGLFRIFQVWEEINRHVSGDTIELYLMGGEETLFAEDMKKFLSSYPNAHNLGWVDDAEHVRTLQSSHAVLAPALEEGQVSAVMEAMSCGAVPILTRQCGIDIENGVEGFYIEDVTSASEMAGYMIQLIQDRAMYEKMSQKAIELVKKDHTWSNFAETITNIISA